uniref:Putative structural protein n=1 Tax=viral metagenome TaxID=1070528 RepID=A0A6M3IJD1_9ZZZZ
MEPKEPDNGKFQDLVNHCVDLFEDIEGSEYRAEKIQEIKESRARYEQEEDPKYADFPWENASNDTLPFLTITVDNLEPRLVAGLVGRDPIINFSEGAGQQDERNTRMIEEWYNGELKDKVKIKKITRDMNHDLLLEGTIFPMPEYDSKKIEKRDFQLNEDGDPKLDEKENPIMTVTEEKVFEGGTVRMIPFTDMYIPDNVDEWEDCEFCRIVRMTYAEIMRDREGSGYISENIGPWLAKEAGEKEISDDDQTITQAQGNVKVTPKKMINFIEAHVSYIYKEEDDEDEDIEDFTETRLIVLIEKEKKIVVRVRKQIDVNWKNEKTIKRIRLYPEAGRTYGTTMYRKIKSIQNGATRMFNQIVNISYLTMLPWYLYADSTGMPSDVNLYPGKGVKVDNPKDVVFPKFQVDPRQYIDFIYIFTQLWERLASIGDLQIGRFKEKGGDHTATETLAVIQEGNIKHNYQAQMFREEYLSVFRTLYDLYYQHMPLFKVIKYQGKMERMTRAMMQRQKNFTLTGSTETANKLIERKENEDMFKMFGQDPMVNPIKIREDLLTSYNRTNVKEYIKPEFAFIFGALSEMPQLLPMVVQNIQEVLKRAQEIEGKEKDAGRSGNKPGIRPVQKGASAFGGQPGVGRSEAVGKVVGGTP